MQDELQIDGARLSIEDVVAVARGARPVRLATTAREAMEQSRAAAQALVDGGTPIYGLTTGAGALDTHAIAPERRGEHQVRLLRSHAAGVGRPLDTDRVRATILVRANALAGGRSAVRPRLVDALLALLDAGLTPEVPEAGSVGASDLAQLAHVGLALLGEGRARLGDGDWIDAARALAGAGLEPLVLEGREGFALFNGIAFSAGVAALVAHDAERLTRAFEDAAALGAFGVGAIDSAYEARSVEARPHPGALASAERLRALAPQREGLREHSSTRCAHQTLGALREAVARLADVVTREINAASDNPTVTGDGWHNNNNANFDGTILAQALDAAAAACIAAAAQSERRTARLLDPDQNGGLPAFLLHPSATPGVDSGLMLAQYSAASLVAELRMAALPASILTMPTCPGEDWTSMSALAARRAADVVERAGTIAAIELLVSAQACDLRGPVPGSLAPIQVWVRARVPTWVEDRIVAHDVRALASDLFDRDPIS